MLYLFAVFDVEIESPSKTFDNIEKKEDLKHDHDEAREAIFQWKAHIIRTKNQERAKENLLTSLQKNASLIVTDWAMKFIQLKYREKQSEWFGKRRINWHVSSVITRNAENSGLEIVICSPILKLCPRLVYGLRNSGKPSRQHQTDQAYRKRGIFAIRWCMLLPQQ